MYNIIEVANTHGGDKGYIIELLKEFEDLTGSFGIKFQPFKYDQIATSDYSYYETYKELFIDSSDWSDIISTALKTKDVWLDIFDDYGIDIFIEHSNSVAGIKLQASVLYNQRVLDRLSSLDLTGTLLIINIAGFNEREILERIEIIGSKLHPKEIILEVGFQGYPTEPSDSGLMKIKRLKEISSNRIVFADHTKGDTAMAKELPVIAALLGADIVEKHVMHSRLETRFDTFSSMTIKGYNEYLNKLNLYRDIINKPFVTDKEEQYLSKTIQIPILGKDIKRGSILSMEDLEYKRCDKDGLRLSDVDKAIKGYNIISRDMKCGDTMKDVDFKKATIATIIACRLKSKRLPNKALLKIGDLESVELCIKNTLRFDNINYTILATSTLPMDDDLSKHTYREDVIFHRGDPDDVIQRYLDITRKLGIDIIVRVTGDCPFHSKDILNFLLESHFKSGADYTSGIGAAVGTNLEIINVNALERVKKHFKDANYSEYMTWYFVNNPEYFKINRVQLPDKWCRDYRLTLDYKEDLEMFNHIQEFFISEDKEYSIEALYKFLDSNPEISQINQHISQKYQSDPNLIETLNRVTRIRP